MSDQNNLTRKDSPPESKAVAPQAANPQELLSMMVQRGSDIDTVALRQMMDMANEWRAEQSRIAYLEAMNRVQAEMEPVVRDARNTHTKSDYARLESINKKLQPVYTRNGFTVSMDSEPTPDPVWIRFTLRLSHVGGHTEERTITLPMDGQGAKGAGNKTPLHAVGSTMTYAARYLRCMAFDLNVVDKQLGYDDDGNAGGGVAQLISAQKAADLQALFDETGIDAARLWKWVDKFAPGVESFDQLTQGQHCEWVENFLNDKLRAAK